MDTEVKDIIELMDQAEDFRPIVKKAIEILKSYSPELNELFDMAIDGIVKKKARMFHQLLSEDFTREEALCIMINTFEALQKAGTSYKYTKK